MKKLLSTPAADGFAMPAEFTPHAGTILIWPVRPGSWGSDPQPAQEAFLKVIGEIARGEEVYLLAGLEQLKAARDAVTRLPSSGGASYPVQVLPLPSDDAWARDCGPTFVTKQVPSGLSAAGDASVVLTGSAASDALAGSAAPDALAGSAASDALAGSAASDALAGSAASDVCKDPDSHCRTLVRGISWKFNAWGGEYDGLYPHWDQDDALAEAFCRQQGYPCYTAGDFVLEGGSIHTDGEGTLLVTASCLLSPGRNPRLSREQIETQLKAYLGVAKILWLPAGIFNDETNGHVDNICCFIRPGEVVLAWTDNQEDPQYALSCACLEYLQGQTDARGRSLVIHKLPIPARPVCFTKEDCRSLSFEEGEDTRQPGERLAASYVNFYFCNQAVLVPQFGGDNQQSDALALKLLQRLLPERKVVGLPARIILLGGGNLHCITQQVPKGEKA